MTFKFDMFAVEVTVKFEILQPVMVVYFIYSILKLLNLIALHYHYYFF